MLFCINRVMNIYIYIYIYHIHTFFSFDILIFNHYVEEVQTLEKQNE